MKPFRERNPALIGLLSLAVIAALLLAAFNASKLPLIGGGRTYYAEFTEASGLKAGDDVRIAGVKVGDVEDVTLNGDTVKVKLLVDTGSEFGAATGASIHVKTLLGAMSLSLDPAGEGQLAEGTTIPVSRTVPAYDPITAFSKLADVSQQIDTKQLAKAFDALSDSVQGAPKQFRGTLRGLTALSDTIASRDQQIGSLLRNVESFSRVLADRNTQLTSLFEDSQTLFSALVQRRQAIHNILVSTQTIANEFGRLVDESHNDLKPALNQLTGVLNILRKNKSELDKAIETLPTFYKLQSITTGDGPWQNGWTPNIGTQLVQMGNYNAEQVPKD